MSAYSTSMEHLPYYSHSLKKKKKKKAASWFPKREWHVGPLLSCAISNLRQIHPVRLGPRQGPSQEAGTAVADAPLIFSGQPRARHTPGLAPGSLVRPRSAGARPLTLFGPPRGDRPGSALAAKHGLAPAHSSQERRRGARGISSAGIQAAAPL